MQRKALKLLRIKNDLTQDGMAEKLGYSRNQYQRIEKGTQDVTLKFLVALSNAFGMSIDEAKKLTKLNKKENDRAAH